MDIELPNAIRLFFPNPSFSQVIFEAVANAFDAKANRIDIRVSIESYNDPQTLKLEISDNGQGFITPKFKHLIKHKQPPGDERRLSHDPSRLKA